MTYDLTKIIDQYIDKNNKIENFSPILLQIGGNDGVQDDVCRNSIIKHKIRSHILEPIPDLFRELRQNYTGYDWVDCYNLAISDKEGFEDISYVYPYDDLPIWCKGLGTLDKSKNFLGSGYGGYKLSQNLSDTHLYKTIQTRIKNLQIETQSLNFFLTNNKINTVDIYVSDTEGYDYIIFNQINWNKIQPKIICMETHTLENTCLINMENMLKKNNYTIINNTWDTVAVKF
jgi:FkbM family methyltransferase